MKTSNAIRILQIVLVLIIMSASVFLNGAEINLISPYNFNRCISEGEIEFRWGYDNPMGLPITNVVLNIYKDTTTLILTEMLDNTTVSFIIKTEEVFDMDISTSYKWEISANIGTARLNAVYYFYLISAAKFGENSLEDGAKCVETTLTLDWSPEEINEFEEYFYEVLVSKNIGFDTLVDVFINSNKTSANMILDHNSQYYWYIRDTECYDNVSDVRTFYTIYLPVTLIEPANSTQCEVYKINNRLFTDLIWEADTSDVIINYKLEIYDGINDLLLRDIILSNNFFPLEITDLLNMTLKWRVQILDFDGSDYCNNDWSEIYYFYTPKSSPILLAPENNVCVPLNVEFKWDVYDIKYTTIEDLETGKIDTIYFDSYIELIVAHDSKLTDSLIIVDTSYLCVDSAGIESIIVKLPNYLKQYFYKYRLKSVVNISDGEIILYSLWSDVDDIKTMPEGPKLIAPANNTFGLESEVMLIWEPLSNIIEYRLEICSEANFNSSKAMFFEAIELTDISYNFHLISGINYYYWRVMAIRDIEFCSSDYSEIRSFSSELKIPEIIAPADFSVEYTNDVTFIWAEVSNANKYDIEYTKDKNAFDNIFSQVVIKNNIVGDRLDVYSLDTNTTYYWRIKAKNNNAVSTWSHIYEFKTGYSEPYQVSLLFPNNNAKDILRFGTYTWRSSIHTERYIINFSTESDFSDNVIEFFTLNSDTTFTLTDAMFNDTFPALEHNTKYYWRMRAINNDVLGNWSSVWSFTTIPEITNITDLISPPNGDTNQYADKINFSWSRITGAVGYRLVVSTMSDNVVLDSNIIYPYLVFNKLEKNTEYKWKVFPFDELGKGLDWSSEWTFKTSNFLNIIDNTFIHSINIVPNPTSNNTTLKVNSNETGIATISIFDINGSIVLSDKIDLSIGNNTLIIDASLLASGNYTVLLYIKDRLIGATSLIIAK